VRVKVIIPNVGMSRETLNEREVMLKRFARPDTEISVNCISAGPESIESCYDEVLAGPEIVRQAVEAQRQGFDAVILYCFSDPALDAVRELLTIPVVGPGEASVFTALTLGHRLSIIAVLQETVPRHVVHLQRLGIPPSRVASVRSVGIPVSRLRDDLTRTYAMLLSVAKQCCDEDGAQVIVLGCLGMAGLGMHLQEELGVPVVDPAFVAVAWAEFLGLLNLRHSKVAYPHPPAKLQIQCPGSGGG
jgi:allantoin racemase